MSAPRRPVSFFTSAAMSAVAWLIVSSAPSARAAASFASVDAVAITRAPHSFAIWIDAVPTPEPAAITSTVSPCWIAAGSGVGTAAIQIAKLYGARVIATASTDAKLAAARALGADETINHATADIAPEVKRLTGKRGADIVVDHAGAATFEHAVLACARGGRIVVCGATEGHEPKLNLRHLFWRQLSVLGSTMASKARLFKLMGLFASGRLRPVVDRVLPLAEVVAAHKLLESRTVFGKLVLTP
jgi:NADPH:quinone reductase-like Zn-dependent oxidoreductase